MNFLACLGAYVLGWVLCNLFLHRLVASVDSNYAKRIRAEMCKDLSVTRKELDSLQAAVDLLKGTRAHYLRGVVNVLASKLAEYTGKTVPTEITEAVVDENERLRAILLSDTITEPCGHARKWLAHRDPIDPQSPTYCTFCEMNRLREDNSRLSKACASGEGVWVWQGDGSDHPESLTCQVLMTANQVRQLTEQLATLRGLLREFTNPLSLAWLLEERVRIIVREDTFTRAKSAAVEGKP